MRMFLFTFGVVFESFLIGIVSLDANEVCLAQQKEFESIIKHGNALDVFYFVNDTKETIQLTWAGENSGVLILVTMTEGENGPGLSSDIYRSENNGKHFTRITEQLGEYIYIRRENGLQRHQNQRDSKELFVVCYDIEDLTKSIIFVTKDGGSSWNRFNVPFVLSGQLRFYPRERLSPWVLTLEEKTSILYLSIDNGRNWEKIHNNVTDYFWSIYDNDPEETIYVLYRPNESKNVTERHTLVKSPDFGKTWIKLLENVIRVWAPRGIRTDLPTSVDRKQLIFTINDESNNGMVDSSSRMSRFLYISHFVDSDNQTAQLSVSTDGGQKFRKVHLPTIQPERFYSVLEVEDDMAFIHVDAPNDTGYGALYTSDVSGTIFTESLRQHLYPNHAPVTDFYRVASMRGTYLATRLNPDRTLHTVITHNRGGTWHALGVPLNVLDACHNKIHPSRMHSTTVATSDHSSNNVLRGNSTFANANEMRANTNEIWTSDPTVNNSTMVDLSTIKVCGLQISNQFSIRNRVIASPPLSISSAPGLILVHGHVATHLKNTPADVFVSSDGGYTWLKALDGPHHYQIANRGGLIVAVPAETLWPDVLRFSTDEGRCWHTIPLRTGNWRTPIANADSSFVEAHVEVHEGIIDKSLSANTSLTSSTTAQPETNISVFHTEQKSSYHDAWPKSKADETVVFTGLVTEPGGRAMAAAVYGYGTISQRWRVAVVDFQANGMISRTCDDDDYEIWTPHFIGSSENDGCLLGVRERYKRLKKDSLCANDYEMETRTEIELCSCTQADYECEYGYSRHIGSMDCVRNPHIPLLDPCKLPKAQRERIHELGYRLIPGDRCKDGWKPPLHNQTIVHLAKLCKDTDFNDFVGMSKHVSGFVIFLLVILFVFITCFCIKCRKQVLDRVKHYFGTGFESARNNLHNYFVPWSWKRPVVSTIPLNSSHNESQTMLWPPASNAVWNVKEPMSFSAHESFNGKSTTHSLNNLRTVFPAKILKPNQVNTTPSIMQRIRNQHLVGTDWNYKQMADKTSLVDAEEINTSAEPFELFYETHDTPTRLFYEDPLSKIIKTQETPQNFHMRQTKLDPILSVHQLSTDQQQFSR